jgi:cell division protease FtsH
MVTMGEFERAKDKIMMGAERKSMIMKEEEKKLTAYHEAGHAIVGRLVPEHDPVYKVSIIPRDDRYSYSKQHLESQLSSLFGGRIAEQQIFGDEAVTTGASNDIERATSIARSMVTQWGLSDRMGPLTYSEDEGEVFLGKSYGKQKTVSDETAQAIDSEVRAIIDRNYQRAVDILKTNNDKLHLMADALLKYETIDSAQIDSIMDGKEPGPPQDWSDDETPPTKPTATSGDSSTDDDPDLDPAKLH